jgi:uncharacterized protein YecE (DUF72 family)
MAQIRIGPSGWRYDGWRGGFYPEDLPRARELAYLGDRFGTVEVNGTFYGLSHPDTFRRWYRAVPSGFRFSVKGSRFITHQKKLSDVGRGLANFFAQGILDLDDKLGPILWQLPERLHFDRRRIDRFLEELPPDTDSAAEAAARHDERIDDVSYGPGRNHRIRHALEVRHSSYLCDEMASLARRHGVALAFSHSSEWPYQEQVTAGFVYVRLHGPGRLYASPYGEEALRSWAARLLTWRDAGTPEGARRFSDLAPPDRKGRDVYVYFDNDEGGHAPRDAAALRRLLSEGAGPA